jgi:glycosyltransferase involved in cell wall biosynthesis
VALSDASNRSFDALFPPFKSGVCGISTDLDKFNPDVKPHAIFDSIKSNNIIGYIGGTQTHQQIVSNVTLLPQIRRKIPDTHLLLIINKWNADQKDRIETMTKVLGLKNSVTIMEHQHPNDMPSLIKGCKVMHLARMYERKYAMTPIKLLDSMAMNKNFVYSKGDAGVSEMWDDPNLAIGKSESEFVSGFINALKRDDEPNMRDELKRRLYDIEGNAKKGISIMKEAIQCRRT